MSDAPHPTGDLIHHDAELGRRYLERLILLSDGVFAIAITLSALEIKPQEVAGQSLWQAWSLPLLVYVLGFALVGGAWVQHRHVMARLERIDRIGTALNLLFLSFVALLPIAVRTFLEEKSEGGTLIYLGVVGATYAGIALLWAYAALVANLAPTAHRPHARAWLLKLLAAPLIVAAGFAFAVHMRLVGTVLAVLGAAFLLWSRLHLRRLALQRPSGSPS